MINSKSALLMLAASSLTALILMARQKLTRVNLEANTQKEAITIWEGEGGNLPGKPHVPE